jgi:hypothetical protein
MASKTGPREARNNRSDDGVLLRANEAALLADCGVDDVLAAVIRGELPSVAAGDGVLVPRGALVAALREHSGLSSLKWFR